MDARRGCYRRGNADVALTGQDSSPERIFPCVIVCLERALESGTDSMEMAERAILRLLCCLFWHPNGEYWIDSMDGIDWQPV